MDILEEELNHVHCCIIMYKAPHNEELKVQVRPYKDSLQVDDDEDLRSPEAVIPTESHSHVAILAIGATFILFLLGWLLYSRIPGKVWPFAWCCQVSCCL